MKSAARVYLFVAAYLMSFGGVLLAQEFVPGNKIRVRVRAVVSKQNMNLFSYRYLLRSTTQGEQPISDFGIIFSMPKELILGTQSPSRWPEPPMMPLDSPFWAIWGPSKKENMLSPGDSLDGFGLLSSVLPGITDYYAEGDHPLPLFEEGMATDSIPGYSDLTPYGPGVVGRTVGPVLPPDPFDPVGFLDTLLSYTFQGDTLAWIAGQATANKYTGYFSSAKTGLQNGNLSAARTTLRLVLRDADVDSSSAISSEAYALLRYNTEYLLSKLPAPPELTALNPGMTIAGSGPFTLLVSGMNFEGSSKVRWNGSDRTTTFIADTVLRASILAMDVAAVGSPAVTVKNGDGSESDAAIFYVISRIAWVDTLIFYKHKALDLGWIDNAGVANSLDQKLDNARKQLEQANNKAAKNILEAFVNELEAQKGKHVSSAAYELLKSNAEYLITRL